MWRQEGGWDREEEAWGLWGGDQEGGGVRTWGERVHGYCESSNYIGYLRLLLRTAIKTLC